jgi:hypothetical protein
VTHLANAMKVTVVDGSTGGLCAGIALAQHRLRSEDLRTRKQPMRSRGAGEFLERYARGRQAWNTQAVEVVAGVIRKVLTPESM